MNGNGVAVPLTQEVLSRWKATEEEVARFFTERRWGSVTVHFQNGVLTHLEVKRLIK